MEIRLYECSEVRVDTTPMDETICADDKETMPQKMVKKLTGYAARFDTYSEDLGGFREIIRKGAFKDNLSANPVFALANHNKDLILGSTKNGSLKVSEDQYGLRVELTPVDTETAREWMSHVESGVIDKMSFAFRVDGKDGERWLRSDQGESVRELHRVKVYDVSLVNQPAYEATTVSAQARSLEEIRAYGESMLSAEKKVEMDSIKHQEEYRKRHLHLLNIA